MCDPNQKRPLESAVPRTPAVAPLRTERTPFAPRPITCLFCDGGILYNSLKSAKIVDFFQNAPVPLGTREEPLNQILRIH